MGRITIKSILILSFIFITAGAATANKHGLRAAQGEAHQIGGKPAQIIVDDASQAVLVLINGEEKVRIDSDGVHVFNGAYFHGPSPDESSEEKGGRP